MTIKEIIEKHLRDNGFDGLFNADGECGCELDDLVPCGGECGLLECEPGYKRKPAGGEDPDREFFIGPDKPGAEPSAAQPPTMTET
jgi:hypothetical protein